MLSRITQKILKFGEKRMAAAKRNVCKFTQSDGKRPAPTPNGIYVRTAIETNVPPPGLPGAPGRSMLKLGIAADQPLLVWPTPHVAELGLRTERVLWIVPAGEQLSLVVENHSSKAVQVSESTPVLCCMPLFTDYDVE